MILRSSSIREVSMTTNVPVVNSTPAVIVFTAPGTTIHVPVQFVRETIRTQRNGQRGTTELHRSIHVHVTNAHKRTTLHIHGEPGALGPKQARPFTQETGHVLFAAAREALQANIHTHSGRSGMRIRIPEIVPDAQEPRPEPTIKTTQVHGIAPEFRVGCIISGVRIVM